MLARRIAVTSVVLALALAGAACGSGGDDDGAESTSATTTIVDATTTTTEAAEDTESTQSAADIKPCELLTTAELEAQASAANAAAFKVTSQDAKPPDPRGMVRCDNFFTVIQNGSEITATLAVEVWTKNAARQYDLFRSASATDSEDVDGFGDKAFWADENAWLAILVDDLLVRLDVGMPGVMKETNRPVAEAVAPIILGRI